MMRDYFWNLTDNRREWKIKHNLMEIIVMTICAVIAGCDVWEDTEIEWFENLADWRNLRAFGMVHSKVEQPDRVTEDVRYFITSLEAVSAFAEAVRKHWGIENSLHWCLDMTFREDISRIRKDHSAENMVVIHHGAQYSQELSSKNQPCKKTTPLRLR